MTGCFRTYLSVCKADSCIGPLPLRGPFPLRGGANANSGIQLRLTSFKQDYTVLSYDLSHVKVPAYKRSGARIRDQVQKYVFKQQSSARTALWPSRPERLICSRRRSYIPATVHIMKCPFRHKLMVSQYNYCRHLL